MTHASRNAFVTKYRSEFEAACKDGNGSEKH